MSLRRSCTIHAGILAIILVSVRPHLLPAQAQQIPEQIGLVYYLDPVQNVLIPLAKELATVRTSSRVLGFGGATSRAELKNKQSSLKLPAGQSYEFFIRGVDPTRFKLYRFEVKEKENRRELLIYRSGAMNVRGQTVLQQSEIPVSITECGESCYKLAPTDVLKEGQYGFSPTDSNDTFSFSLVASSHSAFEVRPTVASNAREREILTNENIIALKKAGFGDELIISKIKTSPGKYKLETEDILALKNQGVSEAIILAMIEATKNH